jgi:hypothetical protein
VAWFARNCRIDGQLNENPNAEESPMKRAGALVPLILLAAIGAIELHAQGRKLRPIERPPAPPVEGEAATPPLPLAAEPATAIPGIAKPELPERQACEKAVRRIAAAYRPGTLETQLHPDFLYRHELLQALGQAELRASNLELRLEALESIRFSAPLREPDGTPAIDCYADLHYRLLYDEVESGQRVTTPPGRAEWRIRFTQTPDRSEVKREGAR